MNATKTEKDTDRINSREEIQTTCSKNPIVTTHAVGMAKFRSPKDQPPSVKKKRDSLRTPYSVYSTVGM